MSKSSFVQAALVAAIEAGWNLQTLNELAIGKLIYADQSNFDHASQDRRERCTEVPSSPSCNDCRARTSSLPTRSGRRKSYARTRTLGGDLLAAAAALRLFARPQPAQQNYELSTGFSTSSRLSTSFSIVVSFHGFLIRRHLSRQAIYVPSLTTFSFAVPKHDVFIRC